MSEDLFASTDSVRAADNCVTPPDDRSRSKKMTSQAGETFFQQNANRQNSRQTKVPVLYPSNFSDVWFILS
jgi:hypothetical protein